MLLSQLLKDHLMVFHKLKQFSFSEHKDLCNFFPERMEIKEKDVTRSINSMCQFHRGKDSAISKNTNDAYLNIADRTLVSPLSCQVIKENDQVLLV